MSELKGEVKEHSSKISELKSEVKEHSSGMSELKGEVRENSSGMSELKGEVKKHSLEISELKGEVNEMKATRRQIQSIRSKGSNDDSASGSIKKKRQQKVISSAHVKRGSSESGSIKKKKRERESNIPALDKQDLSELQICLVKHYTEHYMKSPIAATASSGCETDIDDIYAEPELKLVNHRAPMPTSDNTMSISLKDILSQDKNKCYNIYITGEAGMGKTSLCKYILSSWCKACQADKPNDDLEMALKQYDFLFFILLRYASDKHDIQDMIVSQLLEYIASNNEILSRFKPKSLLQKLFKESSRKCLIMVDGLDEWTAQGRSTMPVISDGVPGRDLNLKYTLMTTTRPWKLDELRLRNHEIDMQIDIIGVKNISTFGEKLISYFNKQFNMKRTYNDFEKCLTNAGLIEMQTIPMLFNYFICLWFDRQDFGKSKTEVYTNIIELCFENAEKRECVTELRQPIHIATDTTITAPDVFKGKEKCNQYKDILKAVGELAFKTAMDKNGMQLAFNSTVGLTYGQLKICLTVGILTQSSIPKMIFKNKRISFLHKTFHEYFSALYMGWLSDIPEEISRLTNTNTDEMEGVLVFLSGIWPLVSERLMQNVLAGTQDKDLWDTSGYVNLILQRLVIRCCIESFKQNGDCLRVKLRKIGFSICGCKSLFRHNIGRSNPEALDASFYCRNFFTTISQMSRKEILQTKGDECMLDFSELYDLKQLWLCDLTLDSLIVTPSLFYLSLISIEINTSYGMVALLSSIARAESLEYLMCCDTRCNNREFTVDLIKQQESVNGMDQERNIDCTGHTSKAYFLHMDLSKLTTLRTIKLENMSISELHVISPVIEDLFLQDIRIAKHDGIVSLMKNLSSLETLTVIKLKNLRCTEHSSNKECFLNIELSKLTRLEIISLENISISELALVPVIKELTLKDIKIAKHDVIVSLMECATRLETVYTLNMDNIHCTEHASNEECFLNIDLSNLARLKLFSLVNISISELHVNPTIWCLTLKDCNIAKHDKIASVMTSGEELCVIRDSYCTEHASGDCYRLFYSGRNPYSSDETAPNNRQHVRQNKGYLTMRTIKELIALYDY